LGVKYEKEGEIRGKCKRKRNGKGKIEVKRPTCM
jgi:hypothetical protein